MTPKSSFLVLIVDDDPVVRDLVRSVLREDGHVVVEAVNGKEALEFLVSNHGIAPDLILLDMEMPVMNGAEFLQLVSNYTRLSRIPVLVATEDREKHIDLSKHAAIVGFVRKPFDLEQLVARIRARVQTSVHK
jgi:CheY-like chemotaxis protein